MMNQLVTQGGNNPLIKKESKKREPFNIPVGASVIIETRYHKTRIGTYKGIVTVEGFWDHMIHLESVDEHFYRGDLRFQRTEDILISSNEIYDIKVVREERYVGGAVKKEAVQAEDGGEEKA